MNADYCLHCKSLVNVVEQRVWIDHVGELTTVEEVCAECGSSEVEEVLTCDECGEIGAVREDDGRDWCGKCLQAYLNTPKGKSEFDEWLEMDNARRGREMAR